MIDSNFAQFDRAGNPWITSREQAKMQAQLVPARGGRKIVKIHIPHKDKIPKSRISEIAEMRELRALTISALGGDRTNAPSPRRLQKSGNFHVFEPSPRDRELAPRVHTPKPEPELYPVAAPLRVYTQESAIEHAQRRIKELTDVLANAQARLERLATR
jgi:hypothetical protein